MEIAEFREVGHRLIDWIADYIDTIETRPLFPRVTPRELETSFDEPLPQRPGSLGRPFDELQSKLIPYCCHTNHPGYFGLITPTPTPAGVLADLLASALNQNVGAWSIGPSAVALERRVVRWLTELVGYGSAAGGHLTSGGMMANFVGLKLARDAVSGDRAQHEGVGDASPTGKGCGSTPTPPTAAACFSPSAGRATTGRGWTRRSWRGFTPGSR